MTYQLIHVTGSDLDKFMLIDQLMCRTDGVWAMLTYNGTLRWAVDNVKHVHTFQSSLLVSSVSEFMV